MDDVIKQFFISFNVYHFSLYFFLTNFFQTSILQEVDDINIGVLEGPPLSQTRYSSVMRKIHTIIRQCIFSIGGMLGCISTQHNIQ